jgi:hypothetical protein
MSDFYFQEEEYNENEKSYYRGMWGAHVSDGSGGMPEENTNRA